MKAHFGRKMTDLDSLAAATRRAKEENRSGSAYVITKEVELSGSEFQQFAADLLEDQPWIGKTDGGMTPAGEFRCIRVGMPIAVSVFWSTAKAMITQGIQPLMNKIRRTGAGQAACSFSALRL